MKASVCTEPGQHVALVRTNTEQMNSFKTRIQNFTLASDISIKMTSVFKTLHAAAAANFKGCWFTSASGHIQSFYFNLLDSSNQNWEFEKWIWWWLKVELSYLSQMLQTGKQWAPLVWAKSGDVVGTFAEHIQEIQHRQNHLHVTWC